MKKILFLFLLLGMVQGIWAQPEARRQAAAQKKAAQQNGDIPTLRAQISFPTALPMEETWFGEEISTVNWISTMKPMLRSIIL